MSSSRVLKAAPFVWISYAVSFIAIQNLNELDTVLIVRPFAILLITTVLLLLALRAIFSEDLQATLLTTTFVILFFSYGHVYDQVKGLEFGEILIGRHRYLLMAWLLLATSSIFLIIRLNKSWLIALAQLFTIVGLIVLLFPFGRIVTYLGSNNQSRPWQSSGATKLTYSGSGQPPDVYYIILDSYGRADVMQEIYGFDNSHFLKELESRGFYIASQSIPNHVATGFSLASSLNMNYVQSLEIEIPGGSYPGPLIDPIRDSMVRSNFESLGYQMIATSSGWAATSMVDADIYLAPQVNSLTSDHQSSLLQPNTFELLLIETTILRAPLDLLEGRRDQSILQLLTAFSGNTQHRQLIMFTYDQLHYIPELESPKFVFVHIISPHRPYVFDAAGEFPDQSTPFTLEDISSDGNKVEEFDRYREQLLFINDMTLAAIDDILASSTSKPIVILQSDTGPAFGFDWSQPDSTNLELKASILNAYFLPPSCQSSLYPSISPINTFRILFNCMFNGDFELLDDITFFTNHHSESEYEFTPIDPNKHILNNEN